MMNSPYNRLRQYPQAQDPQMTTPQGLQLGWIPGVGGEGEGDTQGMDKTGGDIGTLLNNYLKKRQQGRMGDVPMPTPGNAA